MSTQDYDRIYDELGRLYPEAHCELNYETPFQLLIATILSAQCTDQRVNMITPILFAKYGSPAAFLAVSPPDLEADIRSCGLYRNKARNILACCRELVYRFGGEVPASFDDLAELPGVGRKTAAVVASNAFGIPALAVDTHVLRVSQRLGLATGSTPARVEAELTAIYAPDQWHDLHHRLIWHGRRMCYARSPACGECPLRHICLYAGHSREGVQSG